MRCGKEFWRAAPSTISADPKQRGALQFRSASNMLECRFYTDCQYSVCRCYYGSLCSWFWDRRRFSFPAQRYQSAKSGQIFGWWSSHAGMAKLKFVPFQPWNCKLDTWHDLRTMVKLQSVGRLTHRHDDFDSKFKSLWILRKTLSHDSSG